MPGRRESRVGSLSAAPPARDSLQRHRAASRAAATARSRLTRPRDVTARRPRPPVAHAPFVYSRASRTGGQVAAPSGGMAVASQLDIAGRDPLHHGESEKQRGGHRGIPAACAASVAP